MGILKWYGVLSGDVEIYPQTESDPAEIGKCWCAVQAHNKREARLKAITDPAMKPWVDAQRGDNKPPMAGLTVEKIEFEEYLQDLQDMEML